MTLSMNEQIPSLHLLCSFVRHTSSVSNKQHHYIFSITRWLILTFTVIYWLVQTEIVVKPGKEKKKQNTINFIIQTAVQLPHLVNISYSYSNSIYTLWKKCNTIIFESSKLQLYLASNRLQWFQLKPPLKGAHPWLGTTDHVNSDDCYEQWIGCWFRSIYNWVCFFAFTIKAGLTSKTKLG